MLMGARMNPYLSPKDAAIRFQVLDTADGWNLEVSIPHSAPFTDRMKVLEWIRGYQTQIHATKPLWSAVLYPARDRYLLEIRRVNSDQELVAAGEHLHSAYEEILEHA